MAYRSRSEYITFGPTLPNLMPCLLLLDSGRVWLTIIPHRIGEPSVLRLTLVNHPDLSYRHRSACDMLNLPLALLRLCPAHLEHPEQLSSPAPPDSNVRECIAQFLLQRTRSIFRP